MRFFRHFIGGSFCGGPLAAVIGILMALQALIGGFGTGAMAFAGMVPQTEICSTEGIKSHARGGTDHGATSEHAGHGSHGIHGTHAGHDDHSAHSKHAGGDSMQMAHAPMAAMDMPGHAMGMGGGTGEGPGEGAHKNHRPDCCLTACQVAAFVVHFGLHSTAPQPVALAAGKDAPAFVALEAVISPRQLGLGGEARGPPLFPI